MEYDFSEADIDILRRVIRDYRNRNPERPRTETVDRPTLYAPEVYIVRTPPGGIPALTEESGTGYTDLPGSADCDVFQIDRSNQTDLLLPTPTEVKVYNLSGQVISGDQWIPAVRDKPGSWVAINNGSAVREPLPDPEAVCTRFYTGYVHLGSVDVTVGDVLTPRQKIGEIGPNPNGAHLHFELGDGVGMITPGSQNFIGSTVEIEEALGVPTIGDYDEDATPATAHTFTEAQVTAIKARIELPLDRGKGWTLVRGSPMHYGPEYYAVDISTPPPVAGSTDEEGEPVYNPIKEEATDVTSRVVYVNDQGGDTHYAVIVEHLIGDCEPIDVLDPVADLLDISSDCNIPFAAGSGGSVTPLIVGNYNGTVTYPTTTLLFYTSQTGVSLQDIGSGVIRVNFAIADETASGLMYHTGLQTVGGEKWFATEAVYVGPSSGTFLGPFDSDTVFGTALHFVNVNDVDPGYYQSARLILGDNSVTGRDVVRLSVTGPAGEAHWELDAASDFATLYVRGWDQSGPDYVPGRYAVRDASGTDQLGGTATTGGLTFVGGLYISGTASGGYTTEEAQDAVGTIVGTTSTIAMTYNDSTPSITAAVVTGSIGTTHLGSDITSAGKALLDDANSSAQLVTLGATTVGAAVFTISNPSAITFLRVNADNSVSLLSASSFRTAIGAGTGDGTVTSIGLTTANGVSGSSSGGTTPSLTITLGDITPNSVVCATDLTVTDGLTDLTLSDTGTTNTPSVLRLSHTTSGTPAAGFGGRFIQLLHSSTNTLRTAGTWDVEWATATDASRKARVIHGVFDTGAVREYMRGEASGTAPMIGFLGSGAIVRPTITGAKGGNAALGSLLTSLANFGLITDSTTA